MTVSELIELLKQYPDDMPVCVEVDGCYNSGDDLCIGTAFKVEQQEWQDYRREEEPTLQAVVISSYNLSFRINDDLLKK